MQGRQAVALWRSLGSTAAIAAMLLAALLAGCGSSSPHRAECEREADRSGFGKDSQFREDAIKGCEEALKSTDASEGTLKE